MKKYTLMFSILVLAMLACNAALPQATTPTQPPSQNIITPQANSQTQLTEASVPRINVQDAKAALDSGQAILVDVRSADSYIASHAVGAISIPLENFENNTILLDKNQWIITYCT